MLNAGVCAIRLNVLLGEYFMKKLWSEVSAILPGKGVVADKKLTEVLDILERLKNRTVQFIGEVHLSAGTITESEPHSVASKVFGFDNVRDHGFTPMEKWG